MIDSLATLSNAQQLILEAPARIARGQTVKISWQMADLQAPAGPSLILKQYGVKIGTTYAEDLKEDDGNGGKRKVRVGWVYVRPTQHRWADYVLRRTQGEFIVTTRPHPANKNVQPGPVGESWGKPTRASGLGGMVDEAISGAFGYKTTSGRKGIEHLPGVSGLNNREAGAPKPSKPKPKRSKASKARRGFMRELRSLW